MSPKDIMRMTDDYEVQFQLFYAQIKKLIPSLQVLAIELLFKSLFGIGGGSLVSAIQKDPFQLLKNRKGTEPITAMIDKDVELTLQGTLLYGLAMRDFV